MYCYKLVLWEHINICGRFVAKSMEYTVHENRRCATINHCIGEFLKIRNCGTYFFGIFQDSEVFLPKVVTMEQL
jgi:hypothetical protein